MNNAIETVSAKIAALLRQKGWTLSCAESCTGGGIAYALTSVAGSSNWFNQSWVTYSNQAKQNMLGVPESVLWQYGAVSMETVEAMVTGCASAANAQVAISVSGIAGPGGGSADKPVGLVWFGFFIDGKVVTQKQVFAGDRQEVRFQAIEFALSFIAESLAA